MFAAGQHTQKRARHNSETLGEMSSSEQDNSTETAERAHGASRLEDAVLRLRSRLARARGFREHVIPFTGYGSTKWVRVFCRVVLLRQKKSGGKPVKKVRGWRSFVGIPVAHTSVQVKIDGHFFTLTTDRGGVIDQIVPVALTPGWHTVWITTQDSEEVSAEIFVVSPSTTLGVVCDIDDTVMVTALPRPFLAAWNSFVRDEHARRAVPGMAVLLERLHQERPDMPVIYLSTGAWNVAPTLNRFLRRNLYPSGPLLLTDWGPTHDRWFRSGREHKTSNLERLTSEFPSIKWVLIGDDGQHDEEIYGAFARKHPDHVRAVAIRELSAPEAILAGGRRHFDRTHNPVTIPWVSAPNGAGLSSEFYTLGIITRQ